MTAEQRGGRGKCRACNSQDLDAINRDLVAGVPLRKLEQRHGISRQSLLDHKRNHLSPAFVALTKEARLEGSAKTILREADEECENLRAIQAAARKNGNALQAISASRALRGWTELRAKITGELDERPQVVVNLQQTEEWIQVQAVVVKFVDEKLGPKDAAELSRRLRVLDAVRK